MWQGRTVTICAMCAPTLSIRLPTIVGLRGLTLLAGTAFNTILGSVPEGSCSIRLHGEVTSSRRALVAG